MEEDREEIGGEQFEQNAAENNAEGQTSKLDRARLRKARKGLRLTQAELAEILGIHRTYFVLLERGKKIPSPRLEKAIIEFIERAENNTYSPQEQLEKGGNARVAIGQAPPRKVPVVSWAAAGQARAYEDLANQIEELVETDCKDSNAFAIILEGDSMETKFYAGDRVVFAPNLAPRNGDAVVAKLTDGRVLFKYFSRTGPEGTRIRLSSENANYGPLEFEQKDFSFIYPAWEIKRKLRR